MATLVKQVGGLTGTAYTLTSASGGGDQFVNDGREVLHVKNGGGSPITVTINSQTLCSQGFDHDLAVVVTNGTEKIIGPFDTARFNDGGGMVQITYSGVTTVTVGLPATA